jgi:methionyl-tRNA formyltransferase
MKLGFVTCVQLGLSCMEAIYAAGGDIALAISLPDEKAVRKSGRVYLDEFCVQRGVPLLKAPHVNDGTVVQSIEAACLDWMFIVGWSQIAGPQILSAPKKGVLGMHPTLLPVGRGRAAIPWAILKGLTETGVTLFKMDEGVDTGPIAAQVSIALTGRTTASELYAAVNDAHVRLIREVVPNLMRGELALRIQDERLATVWPARKPEEGEIDLRGSVWDAEKLVRAVTRPYPGAFYFDHGRKMIIWRARATALQALPDSPFLTFPDGYLVIEESEQE